MIILDCSVIMSGLLIDEENDIAKKVLQKLENDTVRAAVPAHFYLECQNVLLIAFKKKRIDKVIWSEYLKIISDLPLTVDHLELSDTAFLRISQIAEKHELTIYDAIYLDAAKRHNARLVTFDKQLQKAAEKEQLLYKVTIRKQASELA